MTIDISANLEGVITAVVWGCAAVFIFWLLTKD